MVRVELGKGRCRFPGTLGPSRGHYEDQDTKNIAQLVRTRTSILRPADHRCPVLQAVSADEGHLWKANPGRY
jgi:hypothetical protein